MTTPLGRDPACDFRRALIALLVAVSLVGCGGSPATLTPQVTTESTAATTTGSVPSASRTAAPRATPTPTPSPMPTPVPVLVPLVPITGFWSHERTIGRDDLAGLVAGTVTTRAVHVAEGELEPLAAALGVRPAATVTERSAGDIVALLEDDPAALAIVRPESIPPFVRALRVDAVGLFGGDRLRAIDAWPLLVEHPSEATPSTFDPSSLWTLAAGGDVMLDRDVYRLAVLDGRGPGFPWDGGTARITARECCGWPGLEVVRGERTGEPGAVRKLLSGADLTMVNLENPAPDDFSHHPGGLVFTMDPGLLVGLAEAGIDAVSLANNHIGNAGATGVLETLENVAGVGIRPFGAGRDASAAREPAWLTVNGLSIAMLGYDGVASSPDATDARPGAATLDPSAAEADIRAAREAGADVVVVVPHWGPEYTDAATDEQRRIASQLVEAGAGVILGSHSHWAGPLDFVGDHLVVYSMGDLVFDLEHDERTQQGVIVELTFVGPRLAQVELHPTLILDDSQPNLLEPDGGGLDLLDAIARASSRR